MIQINKVANARGCVLRLIAVAIGLFLLVKGGIMANYSSNMPLFSPAGGYGSTAPGGWNFAQTGSSRGAWSQTPASQPASPGVLGAMTGGGGSPTPAPAPTSGGDGGGPSFEDLLNQQYEGMFNQLGEQEAALGTQRAGQEEIARNTYQQGAETLGTQYGQSKGDIEQGQTRALTDLTNALQQSWQQGNVMLGTRGASDSSAAKQYSYALAKTGTQQRGDIMQENSRRLESLKQTYDTNVRGLETDKNNQLLQIANWFSGAQQQVRGMKAEMQAQKSEQILSMAMQELQQVQQQAADQKSILDQWAANTAKTLPQLANMLAQNAQNLPAFQGLGGGMSGGQSGGQGMYGWGQGDREKNIFGV